MSKAPRKSRRKAREFALQALYQWALSGNDAGEIEKQQREDKGFAQCDDQHFKVLFEGVIAKAAQLDELLQPHLDRPMSELSPVEHALLRLGGYEMQNCPDIPYRVVINEAVELTKTYGGTDGHKFVNGVLDKLAAKIRAVEVAAMANKPR
jgi:transcription antitermination protein NusB